MLGLVASSLRFVVTPRPWRIEYPVVVQFPVNDICDSKCQMCNIWQQKRNREISVDEIRRLFSSHLFHRVTAVGLNGGEPTLRRDLPQIGEALFETLPRLKSLSLITNGLHAQRAIRRIDALADVVRRRGGHLDVMVSLDGVGETHDRVRGVRGNFDSAVRVLDHVLARPGVVSARVGCTVIRDNVHGLHELLDFCIARGVYVKYRLGVPHRRLYNLTAPPPKQIGKRTWIDTQPFGLDVEQRWHFGQFLHGLIAEYEPSLSQIQFYRSLAAQVIQGAPRRAGCDWQHRGVTVSSRGELLYCAVQSEALGDGLADDPERLYFGRRAYLDSIVAKKCASCAHDYVGPPGGAQQLALLVDRGLGLTGRSIAGAMRSRPARALLTVKRRLLDPARFSLRRRSEIKAAMAPATTAPRGDEVLICGWYGTETLGDKAILAAIVNLIRSLAPGVRIVVASLVPACTRVTVGQMSELAACEVVDAGTALGRVANCRVVIFGGGPLMAIREISIMEAIFVRAERLGIPSIIAGCGVGPLGSAAANRSIRGLLASASHRIFRDEESRAIAAQSFGLPVQDDPVCEDPASTWLQSLPVERTPGATVPLLALGLRDWPYRQYAPRLSDREGERIRRHCERQIVAALESLVADVPGFTVLPVPFCTHAVGGDDRLLYWRLLRSSESLRRVCDRSLMSQEVTPREYVRRLSNANAMLTMRFHSLVFASTLGIPPVAIDYTGGHGKTHSLGRRLACATFPIECIDADALSQSLRAALTLRPGRRIESGGFSAAFTSAWTECAASRSRASVAR